MRSRTDEIETALRDQGVRVTQARRSVYGILHTAAVPLSAARDRSSTPRGRAFHRSCDGLSNARNPRTLWPGCPGRSAYRRMAVCGACERPSSSDRLLHLRQHLPARCMRSQPYRKNGRTNDRLFEIFFIRFSSTVPVRDAESEGSIACYATTVGQISTRFRSLRRFGIDTLRNTLRGNAVPAERASPARTRIPGAWNVRACYDRHLDHYRGNQPGKLLPCS